jgi:hypothetical protein
MPEDIRSEQKLWKDGGQCPEQRDGKISPFGGAEEKEVGKDKPEESKYTGRPIHKSSI